MSVNASLPPLRAELPDPLVLQNGKRIASPAEWETLARPELLELFRQQVYGQNPVEAPDKLGFEVVERSLTLEGKAEKLLVNISIEGPKGKVTLPLYIYLPRQQEKPKGCFVFIAVRDTELISQADTAPNDFWPVAEIIGRNYATAAIHKNDAAPDDTKQSFGGIFAAYEAPDANREQRADNAWGAIGAWSWAASRAIDYLQTLPELRAVPFAVAGHSRGGKAALWCGAQDERVALTISNNSGNSGAALSRSTRGESVKAINTRFPYWFARNYRAYNDNEQALPIDQHQLLALISPRLLYVASASEDAWADPQSEFQSATMASPAFALYGEKGLVEQGFPQIATPLHEGRIGYHLREGKHSLVTEDWQYFMDFADRHLANR